MKQKVQLLLENLDRLSNSNPDTASFNWYLFQLIVLANLISTVAIVLHYIELIKLQLFRFLPLINNSVTIRLSFLSLNISEKYPQHPWLKIKTTVLYQMETTQWARQTKVPTLLLTKVSHQVRSIPTASVPCSLRFPQVH